MILRVTGFQFLSLHAAYKIQETASLTLPGRNTIVFTVVSQSATSV